MIGRLRPGIVGGPNVRRFIIVVLTIAVLVMVFLPRTAHLVLQGIGQPFAEAVAIPLKGLASLDYAVREWWNHYVALQGIYERNRQLRQQIQILQGELNRYREQAQAAQRLAALLRFREHVPVPTVAARVIGRNASNWYQALILDKGQNDGVEKEMGVVTPAGIVGQIVKTTASTSIVLLITDPNLAVPAVIQRTRDEGLVQGIAHEQKVRMKYIPPLSAVKVGDMVVTSGLTGGFPRGLLIGEVLKVEKGPGDLFQTAWVVPSVDVQTLEEVLIILQARPQEVREMLETPLGSPGGMMTSP
ncbi:MAG: rod shape-determining protein MreC [Nitrospirae bacterium]|nr:MAG: rod shape-determining protein MreC [Nitrospirota bacterium]